MRPGQQNKRGRGRNNNGGGGGGGGGNNNFNRKGQNPLTRTYDSSGPDVKIRGTAQHIAEKYSTLARDAQSAGDRVMAENYLQHAEHYNRIIAAAQSQMQERFQRDDRDGGDDRGWSDARLRLFRRAALGGGVVHGRDLIQAHLATGGEDDWHGAQLMGLPHGGHGAQRLLFAAQLAASARGILLGATQRAGYIRGSDPQRIHLHRIDVHADLTLYAAQALHPFQVCRAGRGR